MVLKGTKFEVRTKNDRKLSYGRRIVCSKPPFVIQFKYEVPSHLTKLSSDEIIFGFYVFA